MHLLDGLLRNWAEIRPDSDDPRLRPVVLACPIAEAVRRTSEVIARLPRWSVVSADPDAGALQATKRTRVWRFIDEARLRFEPDPAGTRVVGRSQARLGKGDFGQNARNLRELTRALRALPEAVPDRQDR